MSGLPDQLLHDTPVDLRSGAPLPRAVTQFALTPPLARSEGLRFAGYAALFGTPDAGRDTIRKGAFARTLATRRDPLPLFWQHRPDLRIGWVDSVAEDNRGLRVVASIDNPDGAAGLSVRQGKVTGLSFGYRTLRSTATPGGRELQDVELFEISVVTNPMQPGARVHLVA